MNLFKDVVPEERQHQHYKAIKEDDYKKRVINAWGDEKLINRDGNGKFIKEFQTEFNSSFWELYIYQCLKKVGCKFDLQYEHPDYVVNLPCQDFLVECTIANNANGDVPEYDINAKFNNKNNLDEMVYKQILRLSNSFYSKYKKYKETYLKKEWVKDKSLNFPSRYFQTKPE